MIRDSLCLLNWNGSSHGFFPATCEYFDADKLHVNTQVIKVEQTFIALRVEMLGVGLSFSEPRFSYIFSRLLVVLVWARTALLGWVFPCLPVKCKRDSFDICESVSWANCAA